ncbi:Ammonium transporter Rh type A [Balamuthia mandrillaris]
MSAEDQAPSEKLPSWDLFFFAFLALQGFTIFAFWLATDFADTTVGNTGGPNSTDDYFSYYNHIALMVFVGFAFLYTFLRKYAYSAMGYTFLAVIVAFEWTILVNVFFDGADRDDYFRTDLTIWQLIEGLYGSLAVLISFGAFLGRVSPLVLIFVAWIEPLFFGIVRYLVLLQLNCVDIAGTMHVHIFGAYFGLAVSYFMSMPFLGKGVTDVATFARDRLPSYTSNITAFLGTLLIFVAFPSFNAVHSDDDSQFRVIINTVLALTTSGAFAFITSRTLRGGKFFMADVQNGVLAGGIIVGSATTVVVSPGGAMVVGAVGGIATVVANAYLTPVLERKGIVDVAGVHNLHGIPGLLGALGGIASSAIVGDDDLIYGQPTTNVLPEGEDQPGYQTAGLFISLGIGLGGGFIVGLFVFFINRVVEKLRSSLVLKTFFSDEAGWFVPTDFERTEGEAV